MSKYHVSNGNWVTGIMVSENFSCISLHARTNSSAIIFACWARTTNAPSQRYTQHEASWQKTVFSRMNFSHEQPQHLQMLGLNSALRQDIVLQEGFPSVKMSQDSADVLQDSMQSVLNDLSHSCNAGQESACIRVCPLRANICFLIAFVAFLSCFLLPSNKATPPTVSFSPFNWTCRGILDGETMLETVRNCLCIPCIFNDQKILLTWCSWAWQGLIKALISFDVAERDSLFKALISIDAAERDSLFEARLDVAARQSSHSPRRAPSLIHFRIFTPLFCSHDIPHWIYLCVVAPLDYYHDSPHLI